MNESRIVSLFSGAGGMSLGFANIGLSPTLAVELDADALATYRENLHCDALRADIGSDASKIVYEVRRRIGNSEIMAVIGGPPCQGFSTAGARDSHDPRNRLVFSYLNVVQELRPNWFLFENVEGLITSGGGDALASLAKQFVSLGYVLRIDKVNFASFGVPQARKRVVIIGNRHGWWFDIPRGSFAFDGKKHRGTGETQAATVGQALLGLPGPAASLAASLEYADPLPASDYDGRMRVGNLNGVTQHVCGSYDRDVERICLLKPGQSMRDLPEELWPESYFSRAFRRVSDGVPTERRGGAPAGLRRLVANQVSLTITGASTRELIHPEQDRPLSLRECARLQTFPDRFAFSGKFSSIAQQIGNAFPPLAATEFAAWMAEMEGQAGSETPPRPATPGIIGFRLTESFGKSPALTQTEARLLNLSQTGGMLVAKRPVIPAQRDLLAKRRGRVPTASSALDVEARRLITTARIGASTVMDDRELARLVSVVLRDLRHNSLVPDWVNVPDSSYYAIALDWFTKDAERPFDFDRFFLECDGRVDDFRVIFECICSIHKRRRRYARILETQPIPTMEQIARRGLLEYGLVPFPALTSWLTWRKWIFDIDNRSGQETGYMFEPVLATSLGGSPYSSHSSPILRKGEAGRRRQVDCVVVDGGRKLAYEFKARVTIAASGQGRFREELDFPEDCRLSGYTPVLLVMDSTPNEKLDKLVAAFEAANGEHYLGEQVWQHLEQRSGPQIARFVSTYVRDPIVQIAEHEQDLLDLKLQYRRRQGQDYIDIQVGEQPWSIERHRENETEEVPENDDSFTA
jgi:DNA (cytosine-5)-methyltransferase 1